MILIVVSLQEIYKGLFMKCHTGEKWEASFNLDVIIILRLIHFPLSERYATYTAVIGTSKKCHFFLPFRQKTISEKKRPIIASRDDEAICPSKLSPSKDFKAWPLNAVERRCACNIMSNDPGYNVFTFRLYGSGEFLA
jgi:hypothetical protein